MLDAQGCHSLCCLGSESTIGHNKLRDAIALGMAVVDPSTVTEAPGLVPSRPELRPANVLTRAARPNGLAAVDVGVASPEAAGAGDDCLEAMATTKYAHYGPAVLAELREAGIEYIPATVSC